jgi:hypothetical protein
MSDPNTADRLYEVTVEGYTAEPFKAASPAAARYAAFKAFTDAGPRIPFRDFLARSRVHEVRT